MQATAAAVSLWSSFLSPFHKIKQDAQKNFMHALCSLSRLRRIYHIEAVRVSALPCASLVLCLARRICFAHSLFLGVSILPWAGSHSPRRLTRNHIEHVSLADAGHARLSGSTYSRLETPSNQTIQSNTRSCSIDSHHTDNCLRNEHQDKADSPDRWIDFNRVCFMLVAFWVY